MVENEITENSAKRISYRELNSSCMSIYLFIVTNFRQFHEGSSRVH
jgi:hypothetical protein